MHFQKQIAFLVLFIGAIISPSLLHSQSKNKEIEIRFQHVYNNTAVQFDTVVYANALQQSFTISKFKYYISNIRLVAENEQKNRIENVHLIDEEEEQSKRILIEVKKNTTYKGIEFTVGVDSANNCSGAQSGVLDPINGMFWTWNNGYIFLKLEGKSPSSSATGKVLEYHIGGYKSPSNNNRIVYLPFKEILNAAQLPTAPILVSVEIAEFFKNPMNIDFEKMPTVTDLINATAISDNYKDMFSVDR